MDKKTRPCEQCPFRTDIPNYLSKVRKQEIANNLLHDGSFTCHKHLDDDHFLFPCKGAAQFLNQVTGTYLSNVCLRMQREQIGEVDNSVPVYRTIKQFVNSGD